MTQVSTEQSDLKELEHAAHENLQLHNGIDDTKTESNNARANNIPFQKYNSLPSKLPISPIEQSKSILDAPSLRIKNLLLSKYRKQISSFSFFPNHTITRFAINYRHTKDETERTKITLFAFEKYIEFHKKYHFDTILLNNNYKKIEIMNCKYNETMWCDAEKFYIYGIDKQGHPIVWFDNTILEKTFNMFSDDKKTGDINLNKLYFYRSIFFRRLFILELKLSKYYNCQIYHFTQIIDVKNISTFEIFNHARKHSRFFKQFSQKSAMLFPETVYQVILINVPLAIRIVVSLLSQFLHVTTMEKLKIFGNDYINQIVDYIDINMIPKKHGGKGIWDIELMNVPKNFPFQCNDLDVLQTDTEKGQTENIEEKQRKNENENENSKKKEKEKERRMTMGKDGINTHTNGSNVGNSVENGGKNAYENVAIDEKQIH